MQLASLLYASTVPTESQLAANSVQICNWRDQEVHIFMRMFLLSNTDYKGTVSVWKNEELIGRNDEKMILQQLMCELPSYTEVRVVGLSEDRRCIRFQVLHGPHKDERWWTTDGCLWQCPEYDGADP